MSVALGTPLSASSFKAMLLGSGELGKEVALELQRFGVEVIAVDRYPNAPAMQVAHRYHVINMLDAYMTEIAPQGIAEKTQIELGYDPIIQQPQLRFSIALD